MPSRATVIVLGHAGRDAEFKDVGTGLATFSIATTKGKKNKSGEWENETTWWNVKCWSKHAQKLVGKVRKGDLVQVTGEVTMEKWQGKDGTEMSSLVVTADMYSVLPLTKHEHGPPAATVQDDSSLPF